MPKNFPGTDITSFKSITMYSETDNILRNTTSFRVNVRNILHNIVNPTNVVLDLNNVVDLYHKSSIFCEFRR